MRISTSQFQRRAVETMLQQQARLSQTQQQLATGKRILNAADDPSAATRAMSLEREIATTRQHQLNAEDAFDRLAMEEDVLASVTNLLQRASELVVQGNNDILNAHDRNLIAVELREQLDELLGLANTRSANGEYLFAGFQGNTMPFTQNGNGEVSFNGDQGQRFVHVGPSVQVAASDCGAEVFQLIRSGNGVFRVQDDPANTGTGVIGASTVVGDFIPDDYSLTFLQAAPEDPVTFEVLDGANNLVASGTYVSGTAIGFNGVELEVSGTPQDGDRFSVTPSGHQDVFATIGQLIEVFEMPEDDPVSRAKLHNTVTRGLDEIHLALDNIGEIRASVGSRMNLVEDQKDYTGAFLLTAQETLSNLQDLDYTEAISRLQQQITGLQAAQQTYLRLQDLSLFNYLR